MSSDRLSRDELFMRIAYTVALRGTCPRASVGALIVKDQRIVSIGYNGAAPGEEHCTDVGCTDLRDVEPPWKKPQELGCPRAVHAEANAIIFAAKAGVATEGCTIYATHSPCPACARLVAGAGIISFVYSEAYRLEEGLALLNKLGIKSYGYKVVL